MLPPQEGSLRESRALHLAPLASQLDVEFLTTAFRTRRCWGSEYWHMVPDLTRSWMGEKLHSRGQTIPMLKVLGLCLEWLPSCS